MAEVIDTRADRAYKLEQEITQGCRALRVAWVVMAEKLSEFHLQKMWEERDCDTFEEWLATPEISLGRSQVYSLIEIYRVLVLEHGLKPQQLTADASKIARVLPAVRRGDVDLDSALSDAETLSRSDLREKYAAASGGGQQTKVMETCKVCGRNCEVPRGDEPVGPGEQIPGQQSIDDGPMSA